MCALAGLAGDFAEGCVGVGGVWCGPVGVVGEVEGVKAEGECLTFKGCEALLQACVEACLAGAVDQVAVVLRGEGSGSGKEKALGLNQKLLSLPIGELAVAVERGAGSDLKELSLEACADASDVLAGCDVEGRACLELIGLRELPATESFVGDAVAAAEGDVVDGVEDEDLTKIVVGCAAEAFGIVGVGEDVLLEGAAVAGVSVGVRDSEAEAVAEAMIHVDLQALIEGRVSLIDLGDGSVTEIRTMGVDSVGAEGLRGSDGRLVHVGFKLLVQGVAAHVGDISDCIEAEVALDRYVPDVGFGLRGLLVDIAGKRWEGAGADCSASGVVYAAASDRNHLLQRSEAAEKYVVGGALTAGVAAEASAKNRLVVERIGYANAWLEEELLHVNVAARQIVEEVVVLSGNSDGDVSVCAGGKAVAEENGSVERVAAASYRITRCGVHLYCSSRSCRRQGQRFRRCSRCCRRGECWCIACRTRGAASA